MQITRYTVTSKKIDHDISVACIADLHGRNPKKVVETLKEMKPDLILLAGDIFEVTNEYMEKRNRNSYEFLKQIKDTAPIFYCFGNHEIYYSHANTESKSYPNPQMNKEFVNTVNTLNINLVNDISKSIELNGNSLVIGGLVCGQDTDPATEFDKPDLSIVNKLDSIQGFKILICHYPHYYEKYLKNTDLDLIVSGHAHGGHWRIFNQGIYAPHQGLFPKYTSGIYDGRFIINRGAVNNSKPIPRFFNPTEIVEILLKKQYAEDT